MATAINDFIIPIDKCLLENLRGMTWGRFELTLSPGRFSYSAFIRG